jgi:hypothetical protein
MSPTPTLKVVKNVNKREVKVEMLGPPRAMELLQLNTLNRPLSDPHVRRIADQIKRSLWKFNGDTIKISTDGEIVDGQHRLWAIIESGVSVETVVVYDVPRDAFATVDTLRKPRNGADILALNGCIQYRKTAAAALTWLVRWQRKPRTFTGPERRVEVAEIEAAFLAHPHIVEAAERAHKSTSGMGSGALLAFIYYIMSNRNQDIGERFMQTLEEPGGRSVNDPFFKFRQWLLANYGSHANAIVIMAMAIKAANAVAAGRKIDTLTWKHQGKKPEAFPEMNF